MGVVGWWCVYGLYLVDVIVVEYVNCYGEILGMR